MPTVEYDAFEGRTFIRPFELLLEAHNDGSYSNSATFQPQQVSNRPVKAMHVFLPRNDNKKKQQGQVGPVLEIQ